MPTLKMCMSDWHNVGKVGGNQITISGGSLHFPPCHFCVVEKLFLLSVHKFLMEEILFVLILCDKVIRLASLNGLRCDAPFLHPGRFQ